LNGNLIPRIEAGGLAEGAYHLLVRHARLVTLENDFALPEKLPYRDLSFRASLRAGNAGDQGRRAAAVWRPA